MRNRVNIGKYTYGYSMIRRSIYFGESLFSLYNSEEMLRRLYRRSLKKYYAKR